MKIGIPSNDEKNIFPRTGTARGFMVYHTEGKEIKRRYYRVLPAHLRHKDGEDESHDHTHKDLVEFLNECDIVLVRNIGKFLKRDFINSDLNYKLVKGDDLNEIIQNYL